MAKDASIKLNLDISAFRKAVTDALKAVKGLTGKPVEIPLSPDTDGAEKKIRDSRGRFVKAGRDAGEGFKSGFTDGAKDADKAVGSIGGKVSKLGAIAGGALGGAAAAGVTALGGKLFEGAMAADEFGDSLEIAFTKQGIQDVEAEIAKTSKSTLDLANNLGLPVERTRELAVSVSSLGGFTGKSAEDLTKLSAGLEVFTNGAVKGEAVAKAFSRGIADPEGAAAIDALSKKYPQLAETLRSNLSPAEKLAEANKVLGKSFETVAEQQSDVGGIINKLQNQLGDVFQQIGGDLLNALIPVAQAVLPVVESLLPILQTFLNALTPVLQQVGGVAIELVKTLAGPLSNLLTSIMTPLVGIIQKLLPVVLLLVQSALKPLGAIIDVVAVFIGELFAALEPVIDVIVGFIPIVANLVGELVTGLVPVIKALAPLLITVVKLVTENKVVMFALQAALAIVAGALQLVVNIIGSLAQAATVIINVITDVIKYISNLINAIASFDLNAIKNAILGISDAQKEQTKTAKASAEATTEAVEASEQLSKVPPPPPPPDPEAAKKYADALRKAKDQLEDLTTAQRKARELAATDLLATEAERAKARLEIETRYQVQALEAERAALQSRGELRVAEEAVIAKRLEILREETADKARDIEGKAQTERIKAAEEAEKKIAEITTKIAEQRLEKLRAQLEAGAVGVASEVLAAQRTVIDNQLSASIDAIAESTPAFKAGAAKIGSEVAAGLINADEARRQTAALRQSVLQGLLATPAEAGDVYALQIREAYDAAATELARGTSEVTQAVNKALEESQTPGFVASLYGIGDAIDGVDFRGLIREVRDANEQIGESQADLVQSLLDGQTSYQDAVNKFGELEEQRAAQTSATAEIAGGVLAAIAQQQLDAANEQINVINTIKAENEKLAKDLVTFEANKNAALEELRKKNFDNEVLYLEAKKKIEDDYQAKKAQVDKQITDNTKKADAAQTQALANIGAAAGTAFAGLLTGAQSSSEALKEIVGATVSSLINLYTPAIIAGFQSIVPGPVGFVLGTAAVSALKALLNAALAGFSEGGYTGNVGTSSVAGVVHGREFVINARDTAKNRALLEHINRGGTVDTFAGAPSNEMAMMRAELQAIRQRLDRVPDLTSRREAVDVSVGLDPVLYERGRHRMMARSLRG